MLDRFLQQLRLIRKYGLSYLIVMLILSTFDMVIPIVTVYGLKVILDAIEEKRGILDIFTFIFFLFLLLLMGVVYLISHGIKSIIVRYKKRKSALKCGNTFIIFQQDAYAAR